MEKYIIQKNGVEVGQGNSINELCIIIGTSLRNYYKLINKSGNKYYFEYKGDTYYIIDVEAYYMMKYNNVMIND